MAKGWTDITKPRRVCASMSLQGPTWELLLSSNTRRFIQRNFALKEAVRRGDVSAVEEYLSLGADPHITWQWLGVHYSLLTAAAYYGHREVVKLLVTAGVSLKGPGKRQPTALHMATKGNHPDVVALLLKEGSDWVARDNHGNTALHLAAESGHSSCVDEILRFGVDVTSKDIQRQETQNFENSNVDISGEHYYSAKSLSFLDTKKELVKKQNDKRNTALHVAASNGHVDIVKALLKYDAGTLTTNRKGETPLHLAAHFGHAGVIKVLVKDPTDIRAIDNKRNTPLHLAASNGHVDVVQALSEYDTGIPAKNREGKTPLHLAAHYGYTNVVKSLVKYDADTNVQDNKGNTPLHTAAASKGHDDVVRALLDLGADTREQNTKEETPLHKAVHCGDIDIVKLLVKNGPTTNVQDDKGNTPLHAAAAYKGHDDVVRALLDAGAVSWKEYTNGETPLHKAVHCGDAVIVNLLLNYGANTKVQDNKGNTPLHAAAAYKGHDDVVRALLEAGADTLEKNTIGETPLHKAAYCGNADVVKLLLKNRTDTRVKDKKGYTLFHAAASKGHAKVVKVLLENGCDTLAGQKGVTPLHLAASNGNVETVNELLKAYDILAKDDKGYTPLHKAVSSNQTKAMKALLKAGSVSVIDDKNSDGYSPLITATVLDQIDMVKELVNAGGNIRIRDNNGLTLLHNAVFWSSYEMVQYFLTDLGFDPLEKDRNPHKKGGALTAKSIADAYRGDAFILELLKKHQTEPDDTTHLGFSWDRPEDNFSFIHDYPESWKMPSGVRNFSRLYDIHLQDKEGMTGLHWVAKHGKNSHVRPLIKKGMYPFVINYKGETPADLANQHGHKDVEWTLTHMRTPKVQGGTQEELYEKLLHLIHNSDDVTPARDLIWNGVPLSPVGACTTESLTLALDLSRPRTVSLLLAAGASLTITTDYESLLNRCFRNPEITSRTKAVIKKAYINMLKYELHYLKDHDELHAGVRHFIMKIEDSMTSAQINQLHWPFSNNVDLSELLIEAARRNCPLLCSLLYQAGGIIFLGRGDENPVTVAIENKHWKTLKALVCNMGASPYALDSKGELLLRKMHPDLEDKIEQITYEKERRKLNFIFQNKKNDSEKKMVQTVLNLQEHLFRNYKPKTASNKKTWITTAGLLIAAQLGLPQLIFLLVKTGGNSVEAVVDNATGTTALHQAASYGKGGCVSLLLDLGANSSRVDHYDQTAMHLAAMFGHVYVSQLFSQYNVDKCYCRAGTTPEKVHHGFKKYLESYEKCGQRSKEFRDINLCNDPKEATEKLLNCLDLKTLLEKQNKMIVDFAEQEARVVKDAVVKELRLICDKVEILNKFYKGKLQIQGSSSDGTKLYAPDEFDFNLILETKLNGIDVVNQEEKSALRNGHELMLRVTTDDLNLEGSNFVTTFYDVVKKCFEDHKLEDKRLSLVPPGVTRNQVGVALHMAWQGDHYPLLLIGVDLVPVLEVPWHEKVPRPFLLPKQSERDVFMISNTDDGSWRCSFASEESEVLQQLSPEELRAYRFCKSFVSYMKCERWMSRNKKNLYTWWGPRKWRIPTIPTFVLKNAFFRCIEKKQMDFIKWPKENILKMAISVFGEMCRNFNHESDNHDCSDFAKIPPYFGGKFQQHKIGFGAPEIVKFLSNEIKEQGYSHTPSPKAVTNKTEKWPHSPEKQGSSYIPLPKVVTNKSKKRSHSPENQGSSRTPLPKAVTNKTENWPHSPNDSEETKKIKLTF